MKPKHVITASIIVVVIAALGVLAFMHPNKTNNTNDNTMTQNQKGPQGKIIHTYEHEAYNTVISSLNNKSTKNLINTSSTQTPIIIQVYRDNCQACELTRQAINVKLASASNKAVEYIQVRYDSEEGQILQALAKHNGVPLVFYIDQNNKSIRVQAGKNVGLISKEIDKLFHI